jgi:hypothetical protein
MIMVPVDSSENVGTNQFLAAGVVRDAPVIVASKQPTQYNPREIARYNTAAPKHDRSKSVPSSQVARHIARHVQYADWDAVAEPSTVILVRVLTRVKQGKILRVADFVAL